MSAPKPRERILEAADRIFGQVGFDAATTREIAEQAGVNKALIHYHFKSKQGLLQSLLDRYYERLVQTLSQALLEEGPLLSRMMEMTDAYIDFLEQNRNFGRIVQREAAGAVGNNRERIREHMVPLFEMGRRAIQEAYPSTREGALAADQLLVSFYGIIITYFTYSDLLADLTGADLMSPKGLAARKLHVRRMLELTLGAIQEQERGTG